MKNKLLVAILSLAALFSVNAAQAEVSRSIITTGVVNREPTNDLEHIQPGTERVIFFTELRDLAEKTVTHVWKYDGEVMAEVKFEVGGPRWRVWSSKTLLPEWSGDWSISVVDSQGNTLAEKSFTVAAAESTGTMDGDKMSEEPADGVNKAESDAAKVEDTPAEAPMEAAGEGEVNEAAEKEGE